MHVANIIQLPPAVEPEAKQSARPLTTRHERPHVVAQPRPQTSVHPRPLYPFKPVRLPTPAGKETSPLFDPSSRPGTRAHTLASLRELFPLRSAGAALHGQTPLPPLSRCVLLAHTHSLRLIYPASRKTLPNAVHEAEQVAEPRYVWHSCENAREGCALICCHLSVLAPLRRWSCRCHSRAHTRVPVRVRMLVRVQRRRVRRVLAGPSSPPWCGRSLQARKMHRRSLPWMLSDPPSFPLKYLMM